LLNAAVFLTSDSNKLSAAGCSSNGNGNSTSSVVAGVVKLEEHASEFFSSSANGRHPLPLECHGLVDQIS